MAILLSFFSDGFIPNYILLLKLRQQIWAKLADKILIPLNCWIESNVFNIKSIWSWLYNSHFVYKCRQCQRSMYRAEMPGNPWWRLHNTNLGFPRHFNWEKIFGTQWYCAWLNQQQHAHPRLNKIPATPNELKLFHRSRFSLQSNAQKTHSLILFQLIITGIG